MFFDPESKSINNCMDLVIGSEALDKMVFVMPVKSVAIGDVVLNNGKYVYITNITEAGNIKGVTWKVAALPPWSRRSTPSWVASPTPRSPPCSP